MDSQRLGRIIASAQAGQAKAYEVLLDEYGPRLYAYFLRSTRRHHEAEDLLGELTVRLVRRLGSYRHSGRFEPWLFRIAANLVRDRIRRLRASPPAMSLTAQDDEGAPAADRLAGADSPPDASLLANEAGIQVREAMETLDETTRQMILLRHMGGMSFKELAELFECPLGTVLARVHRGLQALRERLGADDDNE